jgi:hypothetical protein
VSLTCFRTSSLKMCWHVFLDPGVCDLLCSQRLHFSWGYATGKRRAARFSSLFGCAALQRNTQAHSVIECVGINPRLSRDGDTSGRHFAVSNLPQHPSGRGLVARPGADWRTVRHIQGLGESICTEGKPADLSRAPALSCASRTGGANEGNCRMTARIVRTLPFNVGETQTNLDSVD